DVDHEIEEGGHVEPGDDAHDGSPTRVERGLFFELGVQDLLAEPSDLADRSTLVEELAHPAQDAEILLGVHPVPTGQAARREQAVAALPHAKQRRREAGQARDGSGLVESFLHHWSAATTTFANRRKDGFPSSSVSFLPML